MFKSVLASAVALVLLQGSMPARAQGQSAPPKAVNIFDCRKEIGLSEDQVRVMKAEWDSLQRTMSAAQTRIVKLEGDYAAFLKTNPPVEEARKRLQEIADVGVEVRVTDLVTSRKIMGALTPDQLKKWHDIQARLASGGARH